MSLYWDFFPKKIWTLTIKTRVLLPRLYGMLTVYLTISLVPMINIVSFQLPLPSLSLLYFTCLYGYKVLNHLSPQYISNLFASYESRFPNRDQKLLLIPLFHHAVSTGYNNLPFSLRATDKLQIFRANFWEVPIFLEAWRFGFLSVKKRRI